MGQRVFVKVVGFTDVERHALNTVFRLSDSRDTSYALWMPDAPALPQLALFDGTSYEAPMELESAQMQDMKLIWVGSGAPEQAWRTFERPIFWTEVVASMDQLFAAEPLDFDFGFADSVPSELPDDVVPVKRALIASPDRNERLYLRARLSLADITQADDAETGAQVLELMRQHGYSVAIVDVGLPDVEGWGFLKDLKQAQPPIPHLIVTSSDGAMYQRLRGWLLGPQGFMIKPLHPKRLNRLLRRV